jgi:hypothetical protein
MTVRRFFDRVDEIVLRSHCFSPSFDEARGIDADRSKVVEYAAIYNQLGKVQIIYSRPPKFSQNEDRDRSTLVDGSAVATRLSTGDTEVMMVQQQAWSRVSPEV